MKDESQSSIRRDYILPLQSFIWWSILALSDKYFSISDDYKPDPVGFILTDFVFKTTSIRLHLIWAHF